MHRYFGMAGFLPVLIVSIIGISSGAEAQQINGCWQTAQDAPDHRRICVNESRDVRLTTFRSRSGGGCESYGVVRATVSGNSITFTVPKGKGNCRSRAGAVVGSVKGGFRCQLSGVNRLACSTTWEGYDPIQEVYDRQ
ncbi:MAG: hypothetical protein WD073_02160 [Xanthobacteraceae bacterium]